MEQKDIDIYEILKGMPDGTKLYTPMCGEVELTCLTPNKEAGEAIWTENKNGEYSFNKNGRWMEGGEALLFPSKEMRDWSKFAWKKGDVLVSNNGKIEVIFESFRSDTYQSFVGKHHLDSIDENLYYQDEGEYSTFNFNIETEDAAQCYINTIEERLGGKLNRETLEIEKPEKQAFEIGKLYVFDEEDEDGNVTVIGELIGKNESNDTLTFGNQYEIENEKFVTDQAFDLRISVHEELREATEDETVKFEEACTLLEKSKEQPAFKPFGKVLVRNEERSKWQPAFFVRDLGDEVIFRFKVLPIQSGRVATVSQCIPFEGNENIAFTNYDEDLPF
jgi:hypothetical protein|nr:MAG TPA: hypothetical protein [Caudoviricetes sp.]